MNRKLVRWSLTVAMGGFLFGFDTAVISGAEQDMQQEWSLTDFETGLAVAIALYGTVLGALTGGIPSDKYGRKATLLGVAILYLVSAAGSALAPELFSFMFFRFLGGLGVGASSVVAPVYISEISPPERRGRLVALFQFNIVLGILIAYVSNYFIDGAVSHDWRWMLGAETLPALLFLMLIPGVPESPRWLFTRRGDEDGARKVLEITDPVHVDSAIKQIEKNLKTDLLSGKKPSLFSREMSWPLFLAIAFAFFNQVSGINAIIYYAPRIFSLTGLESSSSLLSSMGIGLINLIFTMIGMFLIDRSGRKKLMYVGSLGLILALALVSWSFYTKNFEGVPAFLFMFIAFFAMSQGAVIWVFISEIFPNRVRAAGQSAGSFTHWILAALIANVFPFFVNRYDGGPIFLFFSIMMGLQLLFIWLAMPETKGRSLENSVT